MFCPRCGAQSPDGTTFCPNCGANMVSSNNAQNTQQTYQQQNFSGQGTYQQGTPVYSGTVQGNSSGITPRNIALAIIFSIITCGIYAIYWFIVLTNEANQLSGRPEDTSGGVAFLLTLVTCGIYGWYWAAKMGEKTDIIKGNPAGSSNVLFILLQVFGLGIINYALIQDAINNAVS